MESHSQAGAGTSSLSMTSASRKIRSTTRLE